MFHSVLSICYKCIIFYRKDGPLLLLVGVIEIFRRRDVYLITTECDLNAELINCGLERFVGDRFTRASFGKPRFDVRLPLMDQF